MSTPHEVACGFIPAFFELLSSNPAELAEMYSLQSSFLVVDYEYGTSEAHGADVFKAVEQWAQLVQGCQLTVDNYTAQPLHSGVCVYVSMTATSETIRHFFQLVTVLEACSLSACDAETYFIRSQVITRPGSIAEEPPAEEEPEPVAEEEPEPVAEPVEQSAEEPPAAPTPKKSRRSPASVHSAANPSAEAANTNSDTTTTTTTNTTTNTAAAAAAAAAPRVSKPKTWASLASAPPSKAEPRQPVKVISAANGSKADLTEPAAPAAPRRQDARDAAAAPAKPHGKGTRGAPLAPVGDRLMFNIDDTVTDEEVRAALGSWAVHVVSLRNNSKKGGGYVFLDFAINEKVMDALKENPPMIGPNKMRMNVYRQKPRE